MAFLHPEDGERWVNVKTCYVCGRAALTRVGAMGFCAAHANLAKRLNVKSWRDFQTWRERKLDAPFKDKE